MVASKKKSKIVVGDYFFVDFLKELLTTIAYHKTSEKVVPTISPFAQFYVSSFTW